MVAPNLTEGIVLCDNQIKSLGTRFFPHPCAKTPICAETPICEDPDDNGNQRTPTQSEACLFFCNSITGCGCPCMAIDVFGRFLPDILLLTKAPVFVWFDGTIVVVVVVFTLTDRASTIPSNIRGCQSGTWSQRGTKVNGSHHGDNPLLRPTGIQIATKSYATLQAMAPTNNKTVHQTSFTPYYREQPRSTRIVFAYPRPAFSATNRTNTFQPVLINNSKFIKATHRTKIRKIEIPRSMVVEALSC